jgi:hypothetical protein
MTPDQERLIKDNLERWIAHHEAAHAIAYKRLGLPCSGVSIVPATNSIGELGIADPIAISDCGDGRPIPDPDEVDDYIVALFAGYFGGKVAKQPRKYAWNMSWPDFEMVMALLPATPRTRGDLWTRAAHLVKRNIALIHSTALRLELHKSLDDVELVLLVAEADGDESASAVLKNYRSESVTSLAEIE